MSDKKMFIICLVGAVLSFLGFIGSTAVCWIFGTGIEIYIIFTVLFVSITTTFFIGFCYFGEMHKQSLHADDGEEVINKTDIIITSPYKNDAA